MMNDKYVTAAVVGLLGFLGVGVGVAGLMSASELRNTSKKLDISMSELRKSSSERITDAAISTAIRSAADNRVKWLTNDLESKAQSSLVAETKRAIDKVVSDTRGALVSKAAASISEADLSINKDALQRDIYQQVLEKCVSDLTASFKKKHDDLMGAISAPDPDRKASIVKDILDSSLSDWQKQELIGKVVENQ